ncbi:glycosyltransferase [Sphingomonas sp. OV641]|uniref:glycosyltransferase n=1 Tax=Sphingomonas sp. OV641 TaxID=1881068 RepID=UPI0015A61ACC|nr:glycosyltransferase [Sphingomonas sp. OV641]
MRSDISRRLVAMRALGHEVHAISWTGGRLDPVLGETELAQARAITASLDVLRVDRGARRVANMLRFPSQVAGRWPSAEARAALLARISARMHALDAVWVDGIHAGALGRWLAEQLGVPLLYRSHNVEHRYLAEQARLATGKSRLLIAANVLGMKRFERALMRDATLFHDISADDLGYWRDTGLTNGRWLPPLADPAILAVADGPEVARTVDLLFLGSLSSPNNLKGLDWYLAHVHPRVVSVLPDVTLTIAGRGPGKALADRLAKLSIPLVADPPEAAALFAGARVMLNPILHGSGVNIKTVDMLATGRPVVTTSKGARGLPADVVAQLTVADKAETFAAATVAAVTEARAGGGGTDRAAMMQRVFGPSAIAEVLALPPSEP